MEASSTAASLAAFADAYVPAAAAKGGARAEEVAQRLIGRLHTLAERLPPGGGAGAFAPPPPPAEEAAAAADAARDARGTLESLEAETAALQARRAEVMRGTDAAAKVAFNREFSSKMGALRERKLEAQRQAGAP